MTAEDTDSNNTATAISAKTTVDICEHGINLKNCKICTKDDLGKLRVKPDEY
jgi:hypothetical protein